MAGMKIEWQKTGNNGLNRTYDCGRNVAHAGSLALGVMQTSESVRDQGGAPFRADLGMALASLRVPYLLVERDKLTTVIAGVERTSDWGQPDDPTGLHNRILEVLREHNA